MQYLISELQFVGFSPVIHKKLLGDPFETGIDLIGVVAFHLQRESFVTEQEHRYLIYKGTNVVKRNEAVVEVLPMKALVELPEKIVPRYTVDLPLTVLNDIRNHERTQYARSFGERTTVHIPVFRTRITGVGTHTGRVHSTYVNSHSIIIL